MRRLVAALALAAGAATAAEPPFNHLDFDYVDLKPKAADDSLTGYGATLSSPLPGSSNYLYLRYSKVEPDMGSSELERLRAGLGYISPMKSGPVFYTLISFERFDDGMLTDDGYGAEAGIRLSLGNRFELGGGARYIDLDEAGNDTGFVASTAVLLADGFSLYANFERLYDQDEFRAGIRLTNTQP